MDTTQLYKQVVKDIKDKIISGHLNPGEKLPSENELLDIYNTSKTTISKSLTILANEGYISTVPRIGNYVSLPREDKYKLNYQEVENIDNLWNKIEITNLEFIEQNQHYQKKLNLSKLFYIEDRIICYDKKTICFNGDYQFNESKLLNYPLSELLSLTNDTFNIKKQITIEASYCPENIAKILQISENETILIIKTKYYDSHGVIIGNCKTHFLKDYINLIATN
ncbi:MAG: GntR family transcriptional regulator [Eubacteriaceae bacterium]